MRCNQARQIDLAEFSAEREDARFAEFRKHYPLCPDCAPEVGRWSRLEAALRAERQPLGNPHPEEAQLLAYAREPGSLGNGPQERVARHLEECVVCRNEVAVLGGFEFSVLDAPPAEPAREPLAKWLREVVVGLAETLFGRIPQPLLVPLALALLLVPAGLLIWGSGAGPGQRTTQVVEQRGEAGEEQGATAVALELAVEPPPAPLPVEPPPSLETPRAGLRVAESGEGPGASQGVSEGVEVVLETPPPVVSLVEVSELPSDAPLPATSPGLVPLQVAF